MDLDISIIWLLKDFDKLTNLHSKFSGSISDGIIVLYYSWSQSCVLSVIAVVGGGEGAAGLSISAMSNAELGTILLAGFEVFQLFGLVDIHAKPAAIKVGELFVTVHDFVSVAWVRHKDACSAHNFISRCLEVKTSKKLVHVEGIIHGQLACVVTGHSRSSNWCNNRKFHFPFFLQKYLFLILIGRIYYYKNLGKESVKKIDVSTI